jgi:signal transduction histidine kinase/CheY-like chemotaxis protein
MNNDKVLLKQLLTAINQVSDAVVIISPKNIVLHINEPFHRLFPASQKSNMLEKDISNFIQILSTSLKHHNNESAEALSRLIKIKLKTNKRLQFEFKNENGRNLRYQDNITAEGYRIGVFKDETSIIALHHQFENACNEAEKLSEAKNNFMAAMSHEVKTPLNAIIGMLDLCILDDYIAQNEYIRRIHKNADKLLELINNVLDFAKFDANKVALSKVPTDLRELSESVIESFAATAIKSNTKLQLYVDPRIPHKLLLDDIRISQVLNNLISNGLKFNDDENPRLSLTINYDIDMQNIVCLVTDNGIGISDKQQKYVFAGFEQASTDTHRKFGGSGLGLSICQRISWLMRGSLTVSSKLGVGTTFNFTFPIPKNTVPQLPEYTSLSALTLITNDEHVFESLSQYKEFFEFETKLSPHIATSLSKNELQFVNLTSGISLEELTKYDSLNRTILLRKMDATSGFYKGYEKLPCISHTPLRLVEVLKKLYEFEPSLKKEISSGFEDRVQPVAATSFQHVSALIVEDNPDNMFVLKRQVEKLSILADFALEPTDAIEYFEHKIYDIVLSDYQMPGMSGAELIEKLRTIELEKQQTPIKMLVITADKTEKCQSECLLAGADEVLMKPLTISKLTSIFGGISKPAHTEMQDIIIESKSSDSPIFNLNVLNKILGDVSDVELNEFFSQYQENLNDAIEHIVSAAEMNDWLTLSSLAHAMKSSALIIGAKPLSEACNDLELACNNGNESAINNAWERTHLHIDKLQRALSERDS